MTNKKNLRPPRPRAGGFGPARLLVGAGLLSLGSLAALAAPNGDLPSARAAAPARAQAEPPRRAQGVKLLATRSHTQCPLPGKKIAVLSIDSRQEWRDHLEGDESSVAGRPIRWAREQVLVYAMNQQPTLGVRIEPAARQLTLHGGLLFWPVREIRPGPGELAATATSRPCLVAVVKRSYYQRIRIVRR
ncbi:MAG: hypothetical protein L6Q75_09435 [Burkholderiaceae bacterium]|nr:hypothetical protein [Burkholderiaceae bacterium]